MPLTDMALRHLAPVERDTKKFDGGGLFLLVRPNGSKLWRFKYRFAGHEKVLALGPYPLISLAAARLKRDEAKRALVDARDPSVEKRLRKMSTAGTTFAEVLAKYEVKRDKEHENGEIGDSAIRKDKQMYAHALPAIGKRPIVDITAPEILSLLHRIEARGSHDTAHRLRSTISRVFRYAIAAGYCKIDPADPLTDALVARTVKHHPKMTRTQDIGRLKATIDDYGGHWARNALLLGLYTFVRPGNVRFAEWHEFDLPAERWRIPADKMKTGYDLIVPLAPQVVRLVQHIQDTSRQSSYLFPSIMSVQKPISDSTLNKALRQMGYDTKKDINAHGFRGTASTWLNESGRFNRDAIERQLAHVDSTVRGIYNAAEYLPERTKAMRAWADFLDTEAALAKMLP